MWLASERPLAAGGQPPNVLLVTLDTTRTDRLGAYGFGDAQTPVLNGLARRGTLFEEAFTSTPMTLPAHATILTGLEPPEHGLRVNGQGRLDDTVPTLAGRLRERGYRTGAFVAAFVLDPRFGLQRGFEVYDADLRDAPKQEIPEPLSVYRPGNRVVDAALAWLAGRVASAAPEPFFCWVHLYDAHRPYLVHPELAGTRFAGVASYDAEIAFTDLQVGRLLAFLERAGLMRRTLVVVVGDHGEGLGDHGELEHGYLLTPEVLHVPLLMALPGVVPRDRRVGAVVSLVDVFPTVLDLAGVPREPGVRGRSLRQALTDEAIGSRPSYAETDLPYTTYRWSPMRSLTAQHWKYVRSARPELYDRARDPGERRNLAASRPEKVARLERLLAGRERWLDSHRAVPVALDAAARRRLGALGYVMTAADAGGTPEPTGLRDVKDMLPLKQLETRMKLGLVRGTLGRDEMLAIARTLVRESPESPSFQHNLGLALVDAGAVDEGVEHLTEAVRIEPGFAEAHLTLANTLARTARLAAAAEHYEAALAARPGLVDAHVGIGNVRAAAGDLEGAARAYEQALAVDPDQPGAHANLGNVLARERRTEAAIAHYERALALSPDLAPVHYRLGLLRSEQGDAQEAVRQWKAALRYDPTLAAAHDRIAQARALQGDLAKAIRHERAAVHGDPNDPRLATQLAWWLATSDDPALRDGPRAVTLAEQASRAAGGEDPLVLDVLAAAYAEEGRTAQSVDTARRALALADRAGDRELVAGLHERLALYEQGRPYRRAAAVPQGAR